MRRGVVLVMLLATLLATLAAPVAAHPAGGAGGGDTLADAAFLGAPPARSFDELPEDGGTHYFAVRLVAASPVRLRVVVETDALLTAPPTLVVAGPGLPNDTFVPRAVDLPPDGRAVSFAGSAARAQLEPWLPARFLTVVDERFVPNASGIFHLAVHAPASGGRFALLVEGEALVHWTEWLTMHEQRANVAAWRGEPQLPRHAFGALAAALPAAAFVAIERRRRAWPLAGMLAAASSALMAASAAVAVAPAAAAVAVAAWLPVAAPAALALATLAIALLRAPLRWPHRAALGAIAVAALLSYSGFLWAPLLAAAAALAPNDEAKPRA